MADYDDGASGQVMNEAYCLKKSYHAKNVDEMTTASGYHNMADRANSKSPVGMNGPKRNTQEGPKAANNKYDY